MAELVDAPDLGSGSERSESSSLLCRTTMKRNILICLPLVLVTFFEVSCNLDTVVSPSVQSSSVLFRTSAEGVNDTITFSDSLQVGDTVRLPMVLNGYYDYLTGFAASTDTTKMHVSFAWDEAFRECLTPSADPDHGILIFEPEKVYACVVTLQYVPLQSGTHRIDLVLKSSAQETYSQWIGHFNAAVK